MPTPIQYPDGRYDYTHQAQWQNANDRVEAQRAFSQDPGERAKIGMALSCADPDTPEAVIAENMTAPPPIRFGMHNDTLTIWDILGNRNLGRVNDFAPTNFSGSQGQFSGTSTPAVPPW